MNAILDIIAKIVHSDRPDDSVRHMLRELLNAPTLAHLRADYLNQPACTVCGHPPTDHEHDEGDPTAGQRSYVACRHDECEGAQCEGIYVAQPDYRRPEQCCGEQCECPATRKDEHGNTYCVLHEYLAAIAGLQTFDVNASEHEITRERRALKSAAAKMLKQLQSPRTTR